MEENTGDGGTGTGNRSKVKDRSKAKDRSKSSSSTLNIYVFPAPLREILHNYKEQHGFKGDSAAARFIMHEALSEWDRKQRVRAHVKKARGQG